MLILSMYSWAFSSRWHYFCFLKSVWPSFLIVACGNYAKANDRTAHCHVNINIAPTGYFCILANGTSFYNLIGKLAECRIEQKLFF